MLTMLTERRWYAIPVQLFTVSGTVDGKVTIPTTKPYKVKQKVRINATGQEQLILEVKRVTSATELYVGPCHGSIDKRTDLTAYTIGGLATIETDEQQRSNVPEQEIPRNVYEEEPTIAIRTIGVDWLGQYYTTDNPFPVTFVADPSSGASPAMVPYKLEISMPLVNTEYLVSLPAGTKRFYMKSRSGNPKLKFAYVSGAVASPAGLFTTIHPGGSFDREEILFPSGKTVYVSSSKAGEILEVEYWT